MTFANFDSFTIGQKEAFLKSLDALDEGDVDALARAIRTEANENVRKAALGVIARTRSPLGLDVAIEVAKDADQPSHLRREALAALAALGDARALDALDAALAQVGDDKLRHAAIDALDQFADPAAVTILVKAVATGNKTIKARLCRLLEGKLHLLPAAERGAAEAPLREIARTDSDAAVRRACFRTLTAFDGPSADFLLGCFEAETDEKNRLRIIEALGLSGEAAAVRALVKLAALDRRQKLAEEAAKVVAPLSSLAEKTGYLRDLLERENVHYANLNARLTVDALTNRRDENYAPLSDFLIDAATTADPEATSAFATLLIAANGGSRDRAGKAISRYIEASPGMAEALNPLRLEVGGESTLAPILQELKTNLDENFSKPVRELNDQTQASWRQTMRYVRAGFFVRIVMSICVFVVGLVLTGWSAFEFLTGGATGDALWGPGASLAAGLASMFAVVYAGPLKDIQQSVNETARANAIFIGFVHSVLQASHLFSSQYLKEDLKIEDVRALNELLQGSVEKAVAQINAAGAGKTDGGAGA